MSSGPWIFSIVVALIAMVMLVTLWILMHRDQKHRSTPLDDDDNELEHHQPNESVNTESTLPAQPKIPTVQANQDDLNYKLWHDLLLLIPNTTWIQTQHQSLVNIQWLCLGPDYYCFTARAELHHDEWTWSFTKA